MDKVPCTVLTGHVAFTLYMQQWSPSAKRVVEWLCEHCYSPPEDTELLHGFHRLTESTQGARPHL